MADTPLLECVGVSKSFGAVRALYRVDFQVGRGEVMALVGDNGAGKSTLIKGIAGIYPFDEGDVRFEGNATRIHSPREAARLGIEVVYQDLALADNLDVVANMFLGRERTRVGVVLDESSMEQASRETLDSLSVTSLRSVRQIVAGLSGGQRQAVAVAKSVMWNSKLVILDEPTAAICSSRFVKFRGVKKVSSSIPNTTAITTRPITMGMDPSSPPRMASHLRLRYVAMDSCAVDGPVPRAGSSVADTPGPTSTSGGVSCCSVVMLPPRRRPSPARASASPR